MCFPIPKCQVFNILFLKWCQRCEDIFISIIYILLLISFFFLGLPWDPKLSLICCVNIALIKRPLTSRRSSLGDPQLTATEIWSHQISAISPKIIANWTNPCGHQITTGSDLCAWCYAMARVSLLSLLPFLVVCLQLISSVYGVKHADFKKCSQVSRSRGHHWFSPVSVVAIERWRTRSLQIRTMPRRILFQRTFSCETVS